MSDIPTCLPTLDEAIAEAEALKERLALLNAYIRAAKKIKAKEPVE